MMDHAPILHCAQVAASAEPLLHLSGARGSSAALLCAHLEQRDLKLLVLVTRDAEEAQKTYDDVRALCRNQVILLPAPSNIPYEMARPDRTVAMARAAALARLSEQLANDTQSPQSTANRPVLLVTSAAALLRKVPSQQAVQQSSLHLRCGATIDAASISAALSQNGFQRVALVEDPGSFTVRGDLIDVWPPNFATPLRLELEFDQLASISSYDPDTQRKLRDGVTLQQVLIAPAHETAIVDQSHESTAEVLRSICDRVALPSSKTRGLIDDVIAGRLFIGEDAYFPARCKLVPLWSYFPEKTALVLQEADGTVQSIIDAYAEIEQSYLLIDQQPHFAPEYHYEHPDGCLGSPARSICLHNVAIAGAAAEGLHKYASPPQDCPQLRIFDQRELTGELAADRTDLGPLVARIAGWLDDDLAVVISARTPTQADRLRTLLSHRELPAEHWQQTPLQAPAGKVSLIQSPLARGLIAKDERLVLLCEEEIFGRRSHRERKKAARQAIVDAIDDLRSLAVGDHVVHVEHGVGKYLGLSHQTVGDSIVDVLVVEYSGGKLLLPVYRLNQVQKYSGEGAPKLDRLGGQTFAKTKARVRKKVRDIADQLLRIYAARHELQRPPLPAPGDDYAQFEAAFPYEETADQAAAIAEVLSDLQKDTVMDRLVCGDVGFGKTEVALRAAHVTAMASRQVALLCPTTVLADQHLRTFRERLAPSGLEVRGMSRFESKKSQTETLLGLKNGSVDVVIGTHRLLSKDVFFKRLGLLIIDEEQRFGVAHKERLKEMRSQVDVLTLSATPIPRTLSLAVGGMLDMSVITTPPQKRRSTRTLVARFDEKLIQSAIERELARGGQVFYVFNRVEGLIERAALLRQLMPSVRVAVGHGQMGERELENTMRSFVDGDIDVLCATAIIESGLDIPRANTIIIDRADLFGLSQLYQLRGRVGRSSERAYCYLLVPPEEKLSTEARSRIEALERYSELGSGFHVATMDMELRGAGELLGADQSGFSSQVGFELFSDMLAQATAELQGREYVEEVDPEISVNVEALLPESYIEDVGLRLSLYKKYASAHSEQEVLALDEELGDRFGAMPAVAREFSRVMRVKTQLRKLRALGLSATEKSVQLHLRADTTLAPERLVQFVAAARDRYSLSPDGRLVRRATLGESFSSGVEHAEKMLSELPWSA